MISWVMMSCDMVDKDFDGVAVRQCPLVLLRREPHSKGAEAVELQPGGKQPTAVHWIHTRRTRSGRRPHIHPLAAKCRPYLQGQVIRVSPYTRTEYTEAEPSALQSLPICEHLLPGFRWLDLRL
jgi:hypothetical protein